MLVVALIAALSGQAAPSDQAAANAVAPLTIRPAVKTPPRTLPDAEIIAQLNALRKARPDFVICLARRDLGSLIPRTVCASLDAWYSLEMARDTQSVVATLKKEPAGSPALAPPDELIQFIKQRLKDPEARALAAQRAAERAAERAAAR